jgi:hypothetical protein
MCHPVAARLFRHKHTIAAPLERLR